MAAEYAEKDKAAFFSRNPRAAVMQKYEAAKLHTVYLTPIVNL